MKKLILLLRLISAAILLQTLYFKFTGAPESVYIFTTVGIEPWGRWGSGFAELIAGILLLIPSTQAYGAVFAVMIMAGAIMSHILFLGINVQNDNGLLFSLALTVFICSGIVALYNKSQLQKTASDLLKWIK